MVETPEHSPTPVPPVPTLGGGRYVLQEQLGEGGMAAVYRAHDTQLGVERAVKLVLPIKGRASIRRRLRAEARAMARVDHPHILAIHDVGQEGDQDYVVMTLAAGGSLGDRLAKGPLKPAVAAHLIAQVLDALAAAHAVGIIHRDVKPQNILLDEASRPLLADFGIALLAHDDRRTRTGVAMGSIAYMPPEQRLDAARVGPQADVYACGATLFALLTGDNPVDLFMAEPDSERFADVPAALLPIVRRATEGRADDRYPTAGAMAQALLDVLATGELDGMEAVTRKTFAEPDEVFSQRSTRGLRSLPTVGTFGGDDTYAPDASAAVADTFAPDEEQVVPAAAALPPERAPSLADELRRVPVVAFVGLGLAALLGMLGSGALAYTLWPQTPPTVRIAAVPPADVAQPASAPAPAPVAPPEAAPEPEAAPVVAPEAAFVADPAPAPARVPQAAPAPVSVPAPVPAPAPVALQAPAGTWEGSMGGVLLTVHLGEGLSGRVVTQFGANRSEVAVRGRYDASTRVLVLEEHGDGALGSYTLQLDEAMGRADGQVVTATHKRPVTLARVP